VQYALRQWNCLSEQSLLQLHSLVSVRSFKDVVFPSRSTLLLWVSKWHQERLVKNNKPQGRPFSASTPDIVERVRDAMLRSLRRSTRWQAHALRLNERSVRRILHKDLHYYPYKIQVAQELSERDMVSRLQFCNEFLDLVKNSTDIVNILRRSDGY